MRERERERERLEKQILTSCFQLVRMVIIIRDDIWTISAHMIPNQSPYCNTRKKKNNNNNLKEGI